MFKIGILMSIMSIKNHTTLPFNDNSIISGALFDLIHYDIWCIHLPIIVIAKYIVIFSNDLLVVNLLSRYVSIGIYCS